MQEVAHDAVRRRPVVAVPAVVMRTQSGVAGELKSTRSAQAHVNPLECVNDASHSSLGVRVERSQWTLVHLSRATALMTAPRDRSGSVGAHVLLALGCSLSTSVSLRVNTIAGDHRARLAEALEPVLALHASLHLRHSM